VCIVSLSINSPNQLNSSTSRINSAAETPEVTAQWIQEILADESALLFVIELPPDIHPSAFDSAVFNGLIPNSTIIGLVGTFRFPEIGYILDKSYWEKGYATEALKGYLDLFWNGVEPDEEDYVTAVVRVEHYASAAVLRKCGLKIEGEEEIRETTNGPIVKVQNWKMIRPREAGDGGLTP
jgi:RimJ/RimL family protein N-acetyltransferase